jgi:hypothetical protein
LLFALCSLRADAHAQPQSLRDTVERYTADRDALGRRYAVPYSAEQRDRLRTYYREWQSRIQSIPYDKLEVEGRIDWHLLDTQLRRELALLDQGERRAGEMRRLLPFAESITGLMESRRRMDTVKPPATADASQRSPSDSARPSNTGRA